MEWIEKPANNEDIKKGIKKVKIYFLVYFFVTIAVMIAGMSMIGNSSKIDIKMVGLFVATIGIAGNCLIKIWCHIKLSNAKILWEMNKHFANQVETELRRSEAQDL